MSGNLRLIMKFNDGRLAWSERHWYYNGTPSPTLPPVSPSVGNIQTVAVLAQALIQARLGVLPFTSRLLGATLSFDDAARDGSFVAGNGPGLYVGSGGAVLDPELSVLCRASSSTPGQVLQSRFYVAPTYQGAVADQSYNPSLDPPWNTSLLAYCNALYYTPTVTGSWGWKSAQYSAAMGSAFIGTASPALVNANGYLTMGVAITAANPYIAAGQIVKISGIVQAQGAQPRLNGRWLVSQVNSTTSFVLERKNSKNWWTALSAAYISGGTITPQYQVIVPYTSVAPLALVKRDRGGTLGLSRGRSRTQRSNV